MAENSELFKWFARTFPGLVQDATDPNYMTSELSPEWQEAEKRRQIKAANDEVLAAVRAKMLAAQQARGTAADAVDPGRIADELARRRAAVQVTVGQQADGLRP